MNDTLLIQQPATAAQRLILLFHGVGANARDLLPLGQAIAQAHAGAMVLSVAAAEPSDLGRGRQWFSVQGISEENRLARIAAALPGFVATVRHWQEVAGLAAEHTSLVGFSQGAIMSLAATQLADPPAAQILSIAGRFATPPTLASAVRVHLVHGTADPVIPAQQSQAAASALQQLGVTHSLDLIPGLGHGIDERALACVLQRLAEGAAP
ncbi:esterase [Uliginosibacterium sp. TH139]|uniref:esterase n=1 Tax=Uliginosibacterium sp. TH139 TaxID=2067453 RepID=UPI000C7BFB64|nr:esterase [Uliginosibacterium sp. TH139]PLK49322.1 esterase [Uliginosibacterium sp. TH139]